VRVQALGAKVAVTVRAPVIETVQRAPETLVHPDQPVKIDAASSGAAVSVTAVAGEVFGTAVVQPAVEPLVQEMSSPVTVPFPRPLVLTVSAQVLGANVAETVRAAVTETVQTFPEYDVQPDQRDRIELGPGVAVSVTTAGGEVTGTSAVHPEVEPVVHEIPPPSTVPVPVPPATTVRRTIFSNVAVTCLA
jgi:hypothetical protein